MMVIDVQEVSMEDTDLARVVGKAAADPEFAESLLADPAAALRSIGIDPTEAMVAAIRDLDADSLRRVAEAFEPQPGAV